MPLIAGGADSCGMIRYSTTTAYLPMSGSQGFPPRDTGLGWRGAPMERCDRVEGQNIHVAQSWPLSLSRAKRPGKGHFHFRDAS